MSSPAPYNDAVALLQAAGLGVAIHLQNDGTFTEPQPHDPNTGASVLWLAVENTSDILEPIELSGGAWQEEGTLYVFVMAPAGDGTTAARALAKNVSNVFRNLGPRNVVYLGGSIGLGHVDDADGKWWTLPVSVRWRYQDFST
jgi:hypothetical protein